MKLSKTWIAIGIVLLLMTISALLIFKWQGSLAKIHIVQTGGVWPSSTAVLTQVGVLEATYNYFKIIWPALVFGILIASIFRTFIPTNWILTLLGKGKTRQHIVGGLVGMPLMLCSCCVTPIFSSVYSSGARLGPSLAVMLASPALNLAALILTFMMFSFEIAIARLLASLVSVFLLSAFIGRIFSKDTPSHTASLKKLTCDIPEKEPKTMGKMILRFSKSLCYTTLITVPFIFVGVILSSIILPIIQTGFGNESIFTILFIALLAVMIAIPTFFEIPLALVLVSIGAPGAAVALLFAGPIINLPSLFVIGRASHIKVAVSLAVGIYVIAVLTGMAVTLF